MTVFVKETGNHRKMWNGNIMASLPITPVNEIIQLRQVGMLRSCRTGVCNWPGTRRGDVENIYALKQNIDEHPGDDYSLNAMIRKTRLNKNKLQQGFKLLLGSSVFDYIQQVRMAHAKSVLETTELSVEDTGYKVGYETKSGFSKAFRRYFGVKPSELRKSK